jgi:hypothetical protein
VLGVVVGTSVVCGVVAVRRCHVLAVAHVVSSSGVAAVRVYLDSLDMV